MLLRETLIHGVNNCAGKMENCCQTNAGYSRTQKPGLTFQLCVTDGIIAVSDEGKGFRSVERGEISEEIIFGGIEKNYYSIVIPQSTLSLLYQTAPLSSSPSAHSCSNRIKTPLDPPMLKSHLQGRDLFPIGCGKERKLVLHDQETAQRGQELKHH